MGTKDSSIPYRNRIRNVMWSSSGIHGDGVFVGGNTVVLPRTRTGSGKPNWRLLIRLGENATTGLNATYTSIDSVPFRWFSEYYEPNVKVRRTEIGSGDVAATCPAGTPNIHTCTLDSASARNKASAKFYKKLRAKQIQMSGPTFLGELAETTRMIRRPFDGIRKQSKDWLDRVRKLGSPVRNPGTWNKNLSNAWLEQSFGWAPLINDASDAYKAFQRLNEKRDSGPITASFVETQQDAGLSSPFGPGQDNVSIGVTSYLRVRFNAHNRSRVIVRYKGHLIASSGQPLLANLALFGFNANEFIPTAWELLPWSFLVDYFTNVGDVLTAASTNTNRLAWVNETIIQDGIFTCQTLIDDKNTDLSNGWTRVNLASDGGRYNIQRRYVSRGLGGLTLPTLSVDFNPGWGQLVNMAALWNQANTIYPQKRNFHL